MIDGLDIAPLSRRERLINVARGHLKLWITIQQRFFKQDDFFDFDYEKVKYRVTINRISTDLEDVSIKQVTEIK